ncbi:thiamine phosphate synthase [Helicobacter sp. MIT 05-5294]|uniref:thiamine phosphate synthase n=1 Tax=Helicobacter sp. MIT 05-5294 TaxID=1548150 RepID=UPI00051FD62D|nr:thiamine phosphate synthase [Helicobacter sp. MIT 05-5294]TLD89237.1 thiamine phosphate synthase [Helicobacter sp. MIT 05-5294]
MRKPIKAYLITEPTLYPTTSLKFYDFYLKIIESHPIHFAAYRDKACHFNPALIEVFLKLNQKHKIPSLLNSNLDLAIQFGFDGVHCNSSQMWQIPLAKTKLPFVFFSAHNLQEMREADKQGANGITISPIFQTPNKGIPLGIDFLKTLNPKDFLAEIFALGGIISQQQLQQLAQTKIQNFASIRYFLS